MTSTLQSIIPKNTPATAKELLDKNRMVEDSRIPLEEILDMVTHHGDTVRSTSMRNGHYLVQKYCKDNRTSGGLYLPDIHVKRTISNLHAIIGRIIIPSAPWKYHHQFPFSKKSPYEGQSGEHIDEIQHRWKNKQKYRKENSEKICDPKDLAQDSHMVYNSYNVARILVEGLIEPLVVVRYVDIELLIPKGELSKVTLGDASMRSGRR